MALTQAKVELSLQLRREKLEQDKLALILESEEKVLKEKVRYFLSFKLGICRHIN